MLKVKDAVVLRFKELCSDRGIKMNALANISGVTPSTVYSLLDDSHRSTTITTIKILCDGLDISLKEFFSSEIFDNLGKEIEYGSRYDKYKGKRRGNTAI